jgi:anti-sigma factor RsiW
MDAEKLNALLIDHALGETIPDIAALMEAYIEKDPAARATLEEWRATAGLAKRALQGNPVILPAFPRAALERSQAMRQWRTRIFWSAGMAACLAVGFMIGTRWEEPTIQVAQAPNGIPSQTSPLPTSTAHIAAVPDFWSVSRFRAIAENSQKPAKIATWTNLFRRPLPWPDR